MKIRLKDMIINGCKHTTEFNTLSEHHTGVVEVDNEAMVEVEDGYVKSVKLCLDPDRPVMEAREATEVLLNELNVPQSGEAPSLIVGKGVLVPAKSLNAVLRALEAVGAEEEVWVTPYALGGSRKMYQVTPFMVRGDVTLTHNLELKTI